MSYKRIIHTVFKKNKYRFVYFSLEIFRDRLIFYAFLLLGTISENSTSCSVLVGEFPKPNPPGLTTTVSCRTERLTKRPNVRRRRRRLIFSTALSSFVMQVTCGATPYELFMHIDVF